MITLPISVAVNLFAVRLTVFDVTFPRDERGVTTVTQEADRGISGSFQPFGEARGRWLPEGASPDAAYVLHTSAAVSIAAPHSGGSDGRQTYVRFGGDLWKLWQPQKWTATSGGMQRYVATKYIDPNGVIV